MPEKLHTDFREFLELLIANHVRFLVVGGYAVSWHGRPRNTEDIDIWIDRSDENARLVLKSLIDFGIADDSQSHLPFTDEDRIVEMGIKPWKIDLFTHIPGLDFLPSYENREVWPIDGLNVPIISLLDLRISKKVSGRPQDLVDLTEHLPKPSSQ